MRNFVDFSPDLHTVVKGTSSDLLGNRTPNSPVFNPADETLHLLSCDIKKFEI
jgi:hypothetical protein